MTFTVVTTQAATQVTVRPPSNPLDDATPRLLAALAECKSEGASRLRIEPGTYHVYPDFGFERFSWISNHDRGLHRTALPIINFHGLEIEATGVEMIVHGQEMVGVMVIDSSDITIRGLSIDWNRPLHFQSEVIGIDPVSGSFDIAVLPACNADLQEGKLVWGEGEIHPPNRALSPWEPWQRKMSYDWWQDLSWNYWLDAKTHLPSTNQPQIDWSTDPKSPGAVVAKLSANTFRITGGIDPLPRVGQIFIAKGMQTQNRTSPAFHLLGTEEILLEDVTVYHAGGMGVIAEDCANITLRHFSVRPRPGSGRLVSTTADATHFSLCRGQIVVEDCHFESQMDDGINVHAVYVPVVSQPSVDSIVVQLQHFQQLGSRIARPGELIRFWRQDRLTTYGTRKAAAVEVLNEDHIKITFAEPLDGFLQPGTCIDTASRNPDLIFRRNTLKNNRARGALVSTGGKVLIEDNHFENQSMFPLHFEADAHFWHESGPVNDVTVRRNTFILRNPKAPFVRMRVRTEVPSSGLPPFYQNIVFEHNTFRGPTRTILEGSRVTHVKFINNEFAWDHDAKPGPNFVLVASSDVSATGNTTPDHQPLSAQYDPSSHDIALPQFAER